MATGFHFETGVAYENAGVQFNVRLIAPSGGQGAELTVTVDDLARNRRLPLTHEASSAVADFTWGYARWLGTKGIRSTREETAVVGKGRSGLTHPQLLQTARDALDMIDQKFSAYKESVVQSKAYSDILFEKRDGGAFLTINRPETFNALRGITLDEMAEALLNVAEDNSVRAVVISGAGPNGFCTGNDQSYDPASDRAAYGGRSEITPHQVVRQMPQPVIAAVDGYCIGNGNILAYQCDFTIATSRSRFGQTGPRVGSPASGHAVAMLAARVGQKRAREIWMMNRQYSAQEAYQMGLINKVVEPDQLWNQVNRWISDIKNISPVLLQTVKISFNQHDDFQAPERSPAQEYLGDFYTSEESRERRQAFLERRPIDPSKNLPYVKIPIRGGRD